MALRVCILCAGLGSRLGSLTSHLNKALVTVGDKPALSHILEQFPKDSEFVVAIGYQGDLVRQFFRLAYPQAKVFFCEVSPYHGRGSGVGTSLLACKDFLMQPFVFTSCDTLIKEPIAELQRNWIGTAPVADNRSYRTARIKSGRISSLIEKSQDTSSGDFAYIGLAGIYSYREFWDDMDEARPKSLLLGEVEGIRGLLRRKIDVFAHEHTWSDTGTTDSLTRARDSYPSTTGAIILDKDDEAIWFINGRVIKYSRDPAFISGRTRRAQILTGYVPPVLGSTANMYCYEKIEGQVLSNVLSLTVLDAFLKYCATLWVPVQLTTSEAKGLSRICDDFYRAKTRQRLEMFYRKFNTEDNRRSVNGEVMPYLDDLLRKIDWDLLNHPHPAKIHGDLHFENVIYVEQSRNFYLLDWRQDFGGNENFGDVYYDLAKLLHGMVISHRIISQNLFSVKEDETSVSIDIHRGKILVESEAYFIRWLEKNGYSTYKTRLLTSLIFLNIAALHHHPYSLLLYYLGKLSLKRLLEE